MDEHKLPGLAGKLALITGELNSIPKNGFNSHFKYNFVKAEDVKEAVRQALSRHGIAFFPQITQIDQTVMEKPQGENRPARTYYHTRISMEFTFIDSESGEIRAMTWYGESDDDADKGISKAVTAATKYFLLNVFLIDTGEGDTDADAPKAGRAKQGQRPAQNPQQPNSNGDSQSGKPEAWETPTWNRKLIAELTKAWAKHYNGNELAQILGVAKWSEWTGGAKGAQEKIEAYHAKATALDQALADPKFDEPYEWEVVKDTVGHLFSHDNHLLNTLKGMWKAKELGAGASNRTTILKLLEHHAAKQQQSA